MNTRYLRPFVSVAVASVLMTFLVSGPNEFNGSEMIMPPASQTTNHVTNQTKGESQMKLGNFSVSLAVKDLQLSKAFYEKLGFSKNPARPSVPRRILALTKSLVD